MSGAWEQRFETARQKRAQQVHQHSEEDLSKSKIRLFHIPDASFQQMGGKSTEREAIWTCPTCQETPKPRHYANGFVPGRCACQREAARLEQEQRERLESWQKQEERKIANRLKCYTWLGQGWTDEGMDAYTFQDFDPSCQSEALLTAIDYAEARRGNLVLWSHKSWGTGKTHLASAIINHLIEQGLSCRFTTAQNLFDAFGARMDANQGYSDLQDMAGSCDVLVVDDLDKVHLTTFKQTIFFAIIDKRYKRHLPTIITTNAQVEVTPIDVVGISDYIGRAAASRLADAANGGLIVREMNGEDYRRRAR